MQIAFLHQVGPDCPPDLPSDEDLSAVQLEAERDQIVREAPLCSGPYALDAWTAGRRIEYRRRPDYWAADLPVRRGQYNFDRVVFEYFQDQAVALEGFKAGVFDVAQVNIAKQWVRDYTGPKFDSGELVKAELAHRNNAGMQAFAFNLRRPLFQDIRVRRALALAFDFEWSNQTLFEGLYRRSNSYFTNSDLAIVSFTPQFERLVAARDASWRIQDNLISGLE